MNFKDYLESKDLSNSTIQWYGRYVLDYITWLDKENTDPDMATAGDITGYLHYLKQKGQATVTRNGHLIAIRHYMDYRVQQGARKDNPAKHIKLRGIKHKILYPPMSIRELESIYHSYPVPEADSADHTKNWFTACRLSRQRNKVMLGLLVWQGLTTAEINNLHTEDLQLQTGTIRVAGTRTSNERTLELKPQQILALMHYLMDTRKELVKLCPNEQEKRLFLPLPAAGKSGITDNNTVNIWKRLTLDIKQQHPRFINCLQIRSSVITHWLGQHNLRKVQYMAGHKYVSSTEAYMVNQTEDLQNDINKFHPIG